MDHPNYARWMAKYQLYLLNMDETHPGLRDILKAGGFAVRRTDHSFSRCPVDLTLEQMVNADAASCQSGIIHATNNFGAQYRWSTTKSANVFLIFFFMCNHTYIVGVDLTTGVRVGRLQSRKWL